MLKTQTRVRIRRGEGVIMEARLPTQYEWGARYAVRVRGTIYRDIPEAEIQEIIEDDVVHVAMNGFAMPVYFPKKPVLVKG